MRHKRPISSASATLISLLASAALTSSCGDDGPSCPPVPSRLVVLGDSINACFGVDGPDSPTCGPKIFHNYLASGIAPALAYQNLAVSGAIVDDIPSEQLATVPSGDGHAMVMIYIGGNDLNALLTLSDADAEPAFAAALTGIREDWATIHAFFQDEAMFPDGVTVVMNNQYNPFDDCTADPYNLSPLKTGLLAQYNAAMAEIADSHDNAVLTDQYTPYLGHGHHFEDSSCPFYQSGLEGWMEDLIHPNVLGHANLAEQWKGVVDGLYEGCQ